LSVIVSIYSSFRRNKDVTRSLFTYDESLMTKALFHLHPIGVVPSDIDFMGHVNNARYLNWVQDAVLEHWNKLAPPETAAKYLWVALKHEITYRKPAFLDDEVIASVVLEKVQGARSFYDTVIKRGEDVLAEVKSSWCCIDAKTLRPARIAADVQAYFFSRD
jgi:acyl-CoA thioester hydrolase